MIDISQTSINDKKPVKFRVYSNTTLDRIPQLRKFRKDQIFAMRVVSTVLPFRVNKYVIDKLIDWDKVPEDPIFQLTFPQREMLEPEHFNRIAELLRSGAEDLEIRSAVREIHRQLNPHPADQLTLNVPFYRGSRLSGIQHKYRETVVFFPSRGQVCHTYCTFCFRWPQFVKDKELHISMTEGHRLRNYLRRHKEVTDLLVTGGDPMVMKTSVLAQYLEPLLESKYDHIDTIRIGTKALTYWPYRFTRDEDSEELLRLFEHIVSKGKNLALMAHFTHWREYDTPECREAIRCVQSTGTIIRTQSPIIRHINDDPEIWIRLWREQVRLGMVPYYMFVERDTGSKRYFELPLERTWEIFQKAIQQVSGLGRTVRGPSMSASPGKVEIQGIAEIKREKCFVLRFIQGRNPDWVQRPFFARYNPKATWLNHLKPAFGKEQFFFEDEFNKMKEEYARLNNDTRHLN